MTRRPILMLVALLLSFGAADAQAQEPQTPTPTPQGVFPWDPAQSGPVVESERRYLDAQELRDRFENHTVHLTLGDMHYGSEYYLPGDRTIWIAANGPCEDGVWDYTSAVFCFRYPGHAESCWRVFEARGSFWAESIDGLLLRIVAVEKRPLNCQPELFS